MAGISALALAMAAAMAAAPVLAQTTTSTTTGTVAGTAVGTSMGAIAGARGLRGGLNDLTLTVSPFAQAVAEAAGEEAGISAFYRDRDYAPIWTGPDDADRRAALLSALARAAEHGLPVSRYDPQALIAAFHAVRSERDRGLLEVEMSRVFLLYGRDLTSGLLDPARLSPDHFKRTLPRPEPEALLAAIADGPPAAVLRGLVPVAPEYARLMRARAMMQDQIDRGGWGPQVTANALRPGDTGAEVVALRNRLIAMGYLDRSATATYDTAIEGAVTRFQIAHGLPADGVAGRATITAINVAPEERMKSILVALERERWLNIPRGERHIWVNLTDFSSRIVDRDRVTFETVSIIGERRSELQTPEFSDMMTYMEINPDWTIPRSIVGRSYLAALQANPYAHGQLQVIDGAGRVVPRDRIDFTAYTARTMPFNLRQPPGPSNPLGKVKFMFPNPWAIYLHDTPTRSLFNTEVLAHSNGCIRLQDPEEFAHVLLAAQTDDPEGKFHRIWRSGQQTRVYLDNPVPVHLVYRTAFTDTRGALNFRPDVYRRDAMLYDALMRAGVAFDRPGS